MSDKLLEAIGGISEQFIAECDDYISQRKASHRRRKLTRVTDRGGLFDIPRKLPEQLCEPNGTQRGYLRHRAVQNVDTASRRVRDRKIGKRAGRLVADGYKAERRNSRHRRLQHI